MDGDDPRYEAGYRDGESSGYADFVLALMDVLPDDVEPVPTQVATYIAALRAEVAAAKGFHGWALMEQA